MASEAKPIVAKQRLLARQTSLVQHLIDPRAFETASAGPGLDGMDADGLRLVGRMSLGKRWNKIRATLPRTFTYVPHVDAISEAGFATRFPPYTNIRYDNAVQFLDYVRNLWRAGPLEPPFLPDLASVEVAMAKIQSLDEAPPETLPDRDGGGAVFRSAPNVELLRCRFDVQTFFDDRKGREPPVERDVRLVVAPAPDKAPRICEVSPKVHDLLRGSIDWRPLAASELQSDDELPGLVRTLAGMNLVEIHR